MEARKQIKGKRKGLGPNIPFKSTLPVTHLLHLGPTS
jgi:hypothetical protein